MKTPDPFSGRWINEHGDQLRICRLILSSYFLAFNIVSVQRPRRRWHEGTRTGNEITWPRTVFGPSYHLTLQSDGALELDAVPGMGNDIVLFDWINWDNSGRMFRRSEDLNWS
jgi:hypothetical protein